MNLAPLGDRAILVRLGSTIDDATHRRVRAVCARLDERPIPGIVEYAPAYASVAVYYDPRAFANAPPLSFHPEEGESPYTQVARLLTDALSQLEDEALPAPRLIEIPVCYGGVFGPDLGDVARVHDLATDEVVRIHTEPDYLVHMLGFAPGFAYLGGLSERIATPRRPSPRTEVPASSVGIGGRQTGVYPIPSPGGWHLIGRTPLRMFDLDRDPPALLRAGDQVRFRAISPNDFRDASSDA